MPLQQKLFAIAAALVVLGFIVEMVRRRRLREEYAALWILTGGVMLLLALWYDLLVGITRVIGAVLPTTTLFLFGLLFLVVISVHFTIVISRLSNQVRSLAQELAILRLQGPGGPNTAAIRAAPSAGADGA
ncbi:MAG: DUF2304 domain-containing protein [Deltaproteobacteria bacterium]|nr:DUF2304 domain-containing protein [Deltaproteobacteria bacterium]